MINFIKRSLNRYIEFYKSISALVIKSFPEHPYRLLSVEQDENENYIALIQIRNKKEIFRMRPEEILSSDDITGSFSQKDIRTLTYLGYLGINSPKYRILAKRLSENDTKLIFAIKERGKKAPLIKTANEISSDEKLITGLRQKDAHMIGYAIGTEQITEEKNQINNFLHLSDNINTKE